MENFKNLLTEQAKALQLDIEKVKEEIIVIEDHLEAKKLFKSLAFKELRSIEKKLEKFDFS